MAKKAYSAFLIVILVGGLVFVGIAHFCIVHAESSIHKPTVPEFTVKFVNASYGVTTTNPYTGLSETKLTSNNSIEITIKNQRFDYSNYQIYYNILIKPHFANDWTEVYPLRNITSSYNGNDVFSYALYIVDSPPQSKSSYTVITFPVVTTELYSASGYDIQRYYSGGEGQEGSYFAFLSAIPTDGQVDFQVGALVGHDSQMWVIEHPFYPTIGGHIAPAVAYDATSDWSNTQTITIDGGASTTTPTASPSQYPTATPDAQDDADQQGFNWTEISLFAALGVIVALLIVIMLMYRRQTKK